MLSTRFLLSAGVGLLLSCVPASLVSAEDSTPVFSPAVTDTFSFLNGDEIVTYNGNGAGNYTGVASPNLNAQTKPLIGLILNSGTTLIPASYTGPKPSTDVNQAKLNSLWNLQASWLSSTNPASNYTVDTGLAANNYYCCINGVFYPKVTGTAPNKVKTFQQTFSWDCAPKADTAATPSLNHITYTPAASRIPTDTSGNIQFTIDTVYRLSCGSSNSTVYTALREYDTPLGPVAGVVDWVVDAPASEMALNGGLTPYDFSNYNTATPTGVAVPFLSLLKSTTFVAASGASALIEPTEYLQVNSVLPDPSSSVFSFSNIGAGSNAPPDEIIACSYKAQGSTIFQAVNDHTLWHVPTPTELVGTGLNYANYQVYCQFKTASVDSYGNPTDTTTVSVKIHIRVMPACDRMSTQKYNFTDIKAALKNSTTKGTDLNFYDVSDVGNTPISKLPDFTVWTTGKTASYPFYSLLSVGDSGSIDLDPLVTYTILKPSATINSDDAGHAVLCRERKRNSDGAYDDSIPVVLVNDKTQFPIGNHLVTCTAWNLEGNPNEVTVVINVMGFVGDTGGSDLCTLPGACGDPQFTGFLGQSFQVHGVSGQVYNVLSTPSLQYNALFSYLDSGRCRKGTQCFSHPGNYFGSVGLLFRAEDGAAHKVEVISGAVDVGFTVMVNGESLAVSSNAVMLGEVALTFISPFELQIDAPDFSLRLANSDYFINQDVSINTALLRRIQQFKQATKSGATEIAAPMLNTLPHGLLGQTWQHKTYANRWKYIEGTLWEYSLADGIMGTEFKYNRFQ